MLNQTAQKTALGAGFILFAAQMAIGASGVFARFALNGTGPFMVSALRLTIASIILLAIYLRSQKQAVSRPHELLFALCGFALAVHFVTWMASLCYVSVATATLIISTTPLWTTLYDLIVLKNKPSTKFWAGFGLAAAGTWLIVMGSGAASTPGHQSDPGHIGEILAAVGGVAFAFYLVAIRAVTDKYATLTMITRTYSWAAIFLWIAALIVGEAIPGYNMQSWAGILAMALISQSFGHTGLNISLKSFAPRVVALSTLLEPVIAGIMASILFGEILSTQMIIGAAVLLFALALVMSDSAASPLKEKEKAEELASL